MVVTISNNEIESMKNLLKNLISAETTAEKGELVAAKLIASELAQSGITSSIDCWDNNRANVFFHVVSGGSKPALLFACHLDVVPSGFLEWNYPPFLGTEASGKIYGRGAVDMKGGIAAVITAIRQIVDSRIKLAGDIVFMAVAGEETDACGAKKILSERSVQLPQLAGVIIPEPTDFDVGVCHRGLLWLTIQTHGKTAHGSSPQLGINAISSMRMFLNELAEYEISSVKHKQLGSCSVSVNTISSGNAINVIPDQCSISLDIRMLPGQKNQDIISDFEKIFAKLKQRDLEFDAKICLIRTVEALQTNENSDFVNAFCSAINVKEPRALKFCTDGPFFASLGAPVVIFGPGKPGLCHKPDEYIEISDLEKAVGYYKNIILRYLT